MQLRLIYSTIQYSNPDLAYNRLRGAICISVLLMLKHTYVTVTFALWMNFDPWFTRPLCSRFL